MKSKTRVMTIKTSNTVFFHQTSLSSEAFTCIICLAPKLVRIFINWTNLAEPTSKCLQIVIWVYWCLPTRFLPMNLSYSWGLSGLWVKRRGELQVRAEGQQNRFLMYNKDKHEVKIWFKNHFVLYFSWLPPLPTPAFWAESLISKLQMRETWLSCDKIQVLWWLPALCSPKPPHHCQLQFKRLQLGCWLDDWNLQWAVNVRVGRVRVTF